MLCGDGAWSAMQKFLHDKDVFFVTDTNVFRHYGEEVKSLFPKAHVCALPAGEKNKNKNSLFRILDEMLSAKLHRSSYVVALGGGVIGDMAGFAASIYMRGTHLVQIPTTLLSQVDSSVGGKTAIDYKKVKNVLGAFYQPERVFCDPRFLSTLPAREIKCGLGEIIKTGVLDGALGDKLLQNAPRLHDLADAHREGLARHFGDIAEQARVVADGAFRQRDHVRAAAEGRARLVESYVPV